ncbi:MAG: molybdenum cofactor guanylyltransferase [Chloroflexota bacterium]|nr:molybdenum cofactor guanylyltransferase [Chloroflexota bacterium]
MSVQPLTGLLLTGGRSSRMGQNKALLSLAPGGMPVVSLAVESLQTVADEILLVGSDPEPYAFLGLPQVPDVFPGAGSLGGIYSGLRAARNSFALAVACDMPFLNPTLLRYMAELPRDYDVLVPVLDEPEPMHAIYSRACLPWMEEKLEAGRYKIVSWFDRARVYCLESNVIRRYDPDLRSFFNMNTPAEWVQAQEMLRAEAHAPGR